MTQDEAERLVRKLAREHQDRATHHWIPRRGEGDDWSVVKIRLPSGMRRDPLEASIESKPKPPQADDPRPAHFRNVGGPYMGG